MTTTPVPAPVLVTSGTGRTGTRPARRPTDRGAPARIGFRRVPVPVDRHDSSTGARALDREPTDLTAHATRTAVTGIGAAPAAQQVGP
ncbi:hypothetical protein [Kocuria sabuli]|uniref:hypothetical protein n=1 Tax=Kocuria sabuli TaxID=3071448 RepID=UPI0034D3978A